MSNFTKLKLCHTLGISQSTHIWVKGALTALLLVLCGNVAKAADVPTSWKDVAFNGDIRYSQWVINSRISDFYANTTQRGFNTYDKNGTQTGSSKGSQKFDYVPGLVAKAVLEAYANYSTFDWSKPWFYSVMNYAKDNRYTLVAQENKTDFSAITLDNMNACKMYFPLMESDALSTGAKSTGETAIANVLTDMKKYNEVYVIGNGSKSGVGGSSNETVKSMFGGWFHKPSYTDQMWCDGLYMGSALLAQIVNYKNSTKNVDQTSDWDLITKQFTISWNQLYDTNKGLLYHAFTANPGDNASSKWAGISNTAGSEVYHSAAFWGRAMGWYFLALVDVLEQMPSDNSNRATLIDYLQKLALGLAKYQDASGCWYQVVDEKDETLTGNYLESSCTSLFAAAYLKAVRLGLLTSNGTYDYKTIGENAFKGAVAQFMKYDTFEPTGTTVQLVHNCASAGLGGDKKRTGSREYYITGSDVGQTNTYTEGKVMGAFIMAATEYERANEKAIRFSYDLAPSYTLTKGGSITAKALGSENISYQWYKSDGSPVSDATTETFTPTESGLYYCEATSGSTTIQTSTTAVTVNEVLTPSESTNAVVWTFTNETLTGTLGTAGTQVKFTSTDDSKTVMTYVSGNGDAITSTNTTTTINDVTYSSYLRENGTGSVSGYRRMEFEAPSSKGTVTIVYATTAGSTTIVDGSDSNKELASLTQANGVAKNTAVTTDVLTTTVGNKIIIYCPAKSYIYSVIWTPINETSGGETTEYTVTLNATDVTGYPQTMTYSGTALTLPTPEKTGYTFDGWYTKAEGGDKVNNPYTPTTDTPLYAHWNINSYTVTTTAVNGKISIVDGEGYSVTSPAEVPYGTKLVFTATPNSGYEFSNWTVTGTTGTESGATYTISSLTKATSVTATFTETSSGGGNNDQKIYKYQVAKAGLPAPAINSSKYITTTEDETGKTGEKLVKMTFGGWKWNGGTYIRPESKKEITDSWTASETQAAGVTALDGFNCWFRGTQDAKHEKKDSVSFMYGKNRYGWFVSPTRENGITTDSHPYTLPVRGSFMTFEPTKNGTLTIYILQNGVWNSDTENNIDIIPGEFRMHAFQITNQRGLVLAEFAPTYSVTNNQKVKAGYTCSQYLTKPETFNNQSTDVSNWKEFWDLSPTERKAVHDNWSDPENNGCQKIIKLDNGSFLAIQKAVVKYQFHVTGNETYYFFSNFSKMGFSGATFQPDAEQPTATPAEGKISTLELSDVAAYNKITATENGIIEGTTLKNYTYTINGTEIAPVAGVTIPQFYSIKLTRTFKPNQWTTLTLPFNLTEEEVQKIFGDGTQIIMLDKATLSSEGGARLHFIYHEIQNVLPGYPYLIKPTLTNITNDANVSVTKADNNTALTSFTVYGKCINPHIDQFEVKTTPYTFKGTPGYSANATNDGKTGYSVNYAKNDIFVSETNGNLYVSGGSSYGKGYRAWLQKNEGTAGVKSISVVMSSFSDDDDTATSIDVAEMAPDLIEALGIQTGVYNLSGQRVANDTRNLKAGIYIVNGKKTVVR